MASQAAARVSDIHVAIDNLRRLAELFERRRAQLAADVGLTVGQWRVLEEIGGEGFMPSMFARERHHSPAAVSKLLRQLADKGLIRVAISPEDGRQRDYDLTQKGRRALDRLQASRERAIERVWATLDPEDVAAFVRCSDALIDRLAHYAEVGAQDDRNDEEA